MNSLLVRIKIFSPRSYIDSYSMYIKAARARSSLFTKLPAHDHDDDKMNTLAFVNFSQPLFVNIFHRQNFAPYGSLL